MKMVMDDQITVFRRSKANIKEQLTNNNFTQFDALLSIKLYSFTEEKLTELKTKLDNLKSELEVLQSTSIGDMWRNDLDNL